MVAVLADWEVLLDHLLRAVASHFQAGAVVLGWMVRRGQLDGVVGQEGAASVEHLQLRLAGVFHQEVRILLGLRESRLGHHARLCEGLRAPRVNRKVGVFIGIGIISDGHS